MTTHVRPTARRVFGAAAVIAIAAGTAASIPSRARRARGR